MGLGSRRLPDETRSDDVPLEVGKLPAPLLTRLLRRHWTPDSSVIVGPSTGFDAAAIQLDGLILVAKSDPITFASTDAAAYLVNVNANDLACLGAAPRWLLVTALLPAGKTTASDVERHFQQLDDACAAHSVTLVGGHTEITPGLDRPILIGTLFGTAAPDRFLRPGGARPGDRILLTKPIAIEGTALLAHELGKRLESLIGSDRVARASALLEDPGISVRRDAEALLAAGGVTALHDPTEGGLATGVFEIATAAGLGAIINGDVVPVLPETAAISAALGLDPLGMLASGSLLATAGADAVPGLIEAGREIGSEPVVIGKITTTDRGFSLLSQDGDRELPRFDRDEVSRALS